MRVVDQMEEIIIDQCERINHLEAEVERLKQDWVKLKEEDLSLVASIWKEKDISEALELENKKLREEKLFVIESLGEMMYIFKYDYPDIHKVYNEEIDIIIKEIS